MNSDARLFRVIGLAIGLCAVAPALAASTPPHSVVQNFFDYLLSPKTDIGQDIQSQDLWLTPGLRKLLRETTVAVTAARRLPEVDGPDPAVPDNGLFLDSWDYPTTCEALTSIPGNAKTRVEVICRWGDEKNYPGTSRKASVFLHNTKGDWKIAEIVLHKSKYARESSVVRMLKSRNTEARALTNRSSGQSKASLLPAANLGH